MRGVVIVVPLLIVSLSLRSQNSLETQLTGVFQGKTLFIQNPYDAEQRKFCVTEVYVNNRQVPLNANLSAIKLDFEKVDLYAPVTIKIIKRDSCDLILLNPDAIRFHSIFSFREVMLNDSLLVWKTAGEKERGKYIVEKYQHGFWEETETIESRGSFGGAEYTHLPDIEKGANKFRVKYIFPNGEYLYSAEIDFHFYPDPVTFTPQKAADRLYLSRHAFYEIFDAGGALVLSGEGAEINVSVLSKGDYVIYFNHEDPGVFSKE